MYIDVRHIESWRRMWRRNDVKSRRLNDKVTWPPIQPMYWQHVLLFVFYLSHGSDIIRVCKIRFVSTSENREKPCLGCKNQICPRVVTLNKLSTTARNPVKLVNISSTVVTIEPKTPVRELQEVKGLRSADITKKTDKAAEVNVNQAK